MHIPGLDDNGGGGEQRALPPEGNYQGVLVDVVDLGLVKGKKFGTNEDKETLKVRLIFQIDEIDNSGDTPQPFVVARRFTASWSDKAKLVEFLSNWKQCPSKEQRKKGGFDLAKLIGTNGNLVVEHFTPAGSDRTYATFTNAIQPISAKTKPMVPQNWVRIKDRPKKS